MIILKNMDIKLDRFLNYTLLVMTILWSVLQEYVVFDGAGRIPSVLAVVCFFVNLYYNKAKIIDVPYVFWGIWVLFAILNTHFKGNHLADPLFFYLGIFRNYVILYVASLEFRRNRDYFLKFVSICLFIYALGAFFTMQDLKNSGRILSFSGNAAVLLLMFFPAFGVLQYYYKKLSFKMFLFYLFVALYFAVVGATRKAIGGIAIIIFMAIIANLDFRSFKKVFFSIVSFVVIYIAFNYMMENTVLGERFLMAEEINDKFIPYQFRDHWFFNFVGDRAGYYIRGWQYFIDNLWTGIGLMNFAVFDYGKHVLHTEYMVQLAECGIIGTTLYLLFMGWMAYNLLYVFFKIEKRETLFYASIYGAILFLSFTTWIYQFPIYFISFGIIIGYCKDKRFKEKLYANRNLQERRLVQ